MQLLEEVAISRKVTISKKVARARNKIKIVRKKFQLRETVTIMRNKKVVEKTITRNKGVIMRKKVTIK